MIELSNEILIKLLIFIVTFIITFTTTIKILKNKSLSTIIGILVASTIILFTPEIKFELLEKGYSFLGIILLMLFPFAVVFWFIYSINLSPTMRKGFWIFYFILNTFILYNQIHLESEIKTTIITVLIFILIGILIFDKTIKSKIEFSRNISRN